jgi:putative ABC transport system permease protein
MNRGLRVPLSLKLLVRDWRAGELTLLLAALVIAVASASAIGFLSDRVNRAMAAQSADLVGGDLIVSSARPLPDALAQAAADRAIASARTVEFASVAVAGDKLEFASVKAVSSTYPVRGSLRVADVAYGADAPAAGVPADGTAWVEPRLLAALNIEVGGRLEIGKASFTVTKVLTQEPGRGGNFFGLGPRVLISLTDLDRTGVIQPGSRVTYALFYAGEPDAITDLRRALAAQLDAHQRLRDARGGNASVGRALDRAERYLGLASLIAVLLAGIAIAMAARRYSQRHYDLSAIARCFGATQKDIVWIYLPQLAVLGVVGAAIGALIGWSAQEVLLALLRDWLPPQLPAPGWTPVVVALLTALVVLIGFALPEVLRLKRVPPLRVLRRELIPLPASGWVIYGAAGLAMALLAWRYTQSLLLTLAVFGGALGGTLLLALLARALLAFGKRFEQGASVAWRSGLRQVWRGGGVSIGQVVAFGLAFMAMAISALVRSDLLSTWQTQLPEHTPNHFALNIMPDEVRAVEEFFRRENIPASAIYPMVRGRLIAINGEPVQRAVTKEDESENDNRADNALRRELNLTWAEQVPPDNAIVEGDWWSASNVTGVSVETQLADRLNIGVGDRLTFSIGGQPLDATVTSLRTVQWDSFHPNFFMIFPPGVLDNFPATFLTSFHLPPDRKPLIGSLVRSFPAVTVIEIDRLLAQVRVLVRHATLAIEFLLLFVLASGFAVLYAALAATLDERFYEGALLRTLGASRRQLRTAHLAEFAALGLFAGLLAAIGTEFAAFVLYTQVFDLAYTPKWQVWLLAPLLGALIVGAAGFYGTRRVVSASPLVLFREL